jgi:hypothetical protein
MSGGSGIFDALQQPGAGNSDQRWSILINSDQECHSALKTCAQRRPAISGGSGSGVVVGWGNQVGGREAASTRGPAGRHSASLLHRGQFCSILIRISQF